METATKGFGSFKEGLSNIKSANIMAVADSFQAVSDALSFTNELGELENSLMSFVDLDHIDEATRKVYKMNAAFG
ncbi:MAG: hypothetical protein KAH25_04880 [Bacteroidales bacterium]|nr:hypothetical protein [Bacteroidales bacterium]